MEALYISDLDGTLLNDNQKVSDESAQIINQLISDGMIFTYATARSFSTAKKVTHNLNLTTPVIIYNGCGMVDPVTERPVHWEKFSTNETDYVMLKVLKHGISPLVYSFINGVEKVSYDRELVNSGQKAYLDSRKGDPRLNPTKKDKLFDGEVFYLTIIGENTELLPLYEEIKDNQDFTITYQKDRDFGTYWLEIMPKSATKANAILQLKQILGAEKIVCFGDGINDLQMFQIADEKYSVENSVEKLKVMSTKVIGNNNKNAVATKLFELFYNS